ncbi:MAG: TadE/TadG family type IV pilus assembly protein [Brevundimonas sp.]|uniref:TadE/TadG family type IV pilus assembly protein n=1 Tax=Brevundimonas sp. TaxID=1871086 RepID=UPI00391DD8BD
MRRLRRRRGREGAAAVEFALIAIPFFAMIFSILELGLIFVLDSVLETATMESGRLIRTGQAQAQGFDKARFKTELCNRMGLFASDCTDRATIDVQVIPQFAVRNLGNPIINGTANPNLTAYNGGGPNSLVLVRVWYAHPLITPFLTQSVSRMGNGKVFLTTATAFRNEAFPSPSPPGPSS